MAKKTYSEELDSLREYLTSTSSEDSKNHLLYPLFKKMFGNEVVTESEAHGADVYVPGKLIVEAKSKYPQWLEGFYQALHYERAHGLSYSAIMVIAHEFVGIWKLKDKELPETIAAIIYRTDPKLSPNKAGKENAKKTQEPQKKEIQKLADYWVDPKAFKDDKVSFTYETYHIKDVLLHLDEKRVQINTHNFISTIERMKPMFPNPIDAIHAFYSIVHVWDVTSSVSIKPDGLSVVVTGKKGNYSSIDVYPLPHKIEDFKQFVNTQYVFTNEGSGLTVDYYFSRFDEAIATIDPEYVKQHGIFFTDDWLSKFAIEFAEEKFSKNLPTDYVFFDPAGGSGNLISSSQDKVEHKIVSELQPDLLKIVENRMKADPFHINTGFTIVPKTVEDKGLNFLDRPASEYIYELKRVLEEQDLKDLLSKKPLAFLLNPPYKNTDENPASKQKANAHYDIDETILNLTGNDAGNERYLAFLGQILNMCQLQVKENNDLSPVVMIFSPTSWLIPRPTYKKFREIWDAYFEYESGFIVKSNEWFKIGGQWPLAFTIWQFNRKEGRKNEIEVADFTDLTKKELAHESAHGVIEKGKIISLRERDDIRVFLPKIDRNGKLVQQPRYDFSHKKSKDDENKIVSGFPINDKKRHYTLNRKCGDIFGEYIGFMDDITPIRVKQDSCVRMSNNPDKVWFRLDNVFINLNDTKVFGGPSDNRSYCAYDLASAKATFSWFAITKALNGKYPLWANQFNIWQPDIKEAQENYWYSLCYAFVLAENRCVVTRFPKDDPVEGAPEIFVDNPLCPTNKNSFWNLYLNDQIVEDPPLANQLINQIKELYNFWNTNYTKGQKIEYMGLQDEPYFKYFDYPDFLTPYSGLIQIRKYAEIKGDQDLISRFETIKKQTNDVKEEIYRLLVEEFNYFE